MTIAMAGKPFEPFPAPAFARQAHDLVQKPAPKPTEDPLGEDDDPFGNDDPSEDQFRRSPDVAF